MSLLISALLIVLLGLTLFISFFLSLISKYYYQKAGRGPRPFYFFIYSIVFALGQIFRLDFFKETLGASISAVCLLVGGIGLISSSVTLYKSMMSVEKR